MGILFSFIELYAKPREADVFFDICESLKPQVGSKKIISSEDVKKALNNLKEMAPTDELRSASKNLNDFLPDCKYYLPGMHTVEGQAEKAEQHFPKIEKTENTTLKAKSESDELSKDFMNASESLPSEYKQPAFQCMSEHKTCKEDEIGLIGCTLALAVCLSERIIPLAGAGKY